MADVTREAMRDVLRERDKRDLVLPPGTYAYLQDTSKGAIRTYVGPAAITPTAQEVPVTYDAKTGKFNQEQSLESAIQQSPVAVEGFYAVLRNPAKGNKHPEEGMPQSGNIDLEVGRKIVVPGPAMFALWPGQAAEVIRGHQLRSNQYLVVRVYNEEEARANWLKAIIKPAAPHTPTNPTNENEGGERNEERTASGKKGEAKRPEPKPEHKKSALAEVPSDLTVGRLFVIRGTEVSFYIPPTGVTVVTEDPARSNSYVREALTLERLEYSILVDENGKKRYAQGPCVVFPEPSEKFIEGRGEKGAPTRKFRAIELNEIQGLHLKVIADFEENGKHYKAGEELWLTGKDTAIYFPREEVAIVKYDGKTKHFSTAVPAGEARYVLNRMDGNIKTTKGPMMLLPDARKEVIVRRILTDRQVGLWYPGNTEALQYNQQLRHMLANVATTRGAPSEGDLNRAMKSARGAPVGAVMAMNYASADSLMESSQVSKDQNFIGDEFVRSATYTEPRTVTLNTKYQGVPVIEAWTGYAVMVVSKSGKRRVEIGPRAVQLEYDESLEVLQLSTGKPKTTDKLLDTSYLRVENNHISDILTVETEDHVTAELKLSYRVNFTGDPEKWFSVENYVKFLCDHERSVLRGAVRKYKIEAFYANSTEILRDIILGTAKSEGGKRVGATFEENGMHIVDVEVLKVTISDEAVRKKLDESQIAVVQSNIDLAAAKRNLEVFKQKELLAREEAETKTATAKQKNELTIAEAESGLKVILARIENAREETENQIEVEKLNQEKLKLVADSGLERARKQEEYKLEMTGLNQKIALDGLHAEVEATVAKFNAAAPKFTEALLALSNNEIMVKVAQALNVQSIIGGNSLSDAMASIFRGTPLDAKLRELLPKLPKNGEPEKRA